jgi:hypothetical protein
MTRVTGRAWIPREVARVLACLGLALSLVAAGCGGGGSPAPAKLVDVSAARTEQVKSFHFTLDIEKVPHTTTGLQLTAAEGDVLVPDRLSAQVTGNFAGIPLTTRLVSVGGKLWIKNPLTGSWQKVDIGTTPAFLLNPQKGVLGVMRGITELRADGSEDVAGVATTRVRGKADVAKVAPLVAVSAGTGTVEVTLWIGKHDEVLRRIQVVGAIARGEPADATRVVEISRLREPVTIKAPEGAT